MFVPYHPLLTPTCLCVTGRFEGFQSVGGHFEGIFFTPNWTVYIKSAGLCRNLVKPWTCVEFVERYCFIILVYP